MCKAISKLFIDFKSDEFYKNYIKIFLCIKIYIKNIYIYIEKKIKDTVRKLTQVDWLSKLRYKK